MTEIARPRHAAGSRTPHEGQASGPIQAPDFSNPRRFKMSKVKSAAPKSKPAGPTSGLRRPPRPVEKLKAERVQLMLKRAPGWKPIQKMRALRRVREFPSAQEAAVFAGFAAELAGIAGQPVDLSLAGQRVVLTLQGRPGRSRSGGGLTEEAVEFASRLG
jgi:pterin-4a-carbinolamine dehydratase